MDAGLDPAWLAEEIPDTAILYMRVHRNMLMANGLIRPGAFSNHGPGMSTDWDKYATPEATRQRAQRHAPADYAVIALAVGAVRAIPLQGVAHTPARANRAHTTVTGEKTERVRLRFLDLSQIVLPLES